MGLCVKYAIEENFMEQGRNSLA